jgi:hypothetical protein
MATGRACLRHSSLLAYALTLAWSGGRFPSEPQHGPTTHVSQRRSDTQTRNSSTAAQITGFRMYIAAQLSMRTRCNHFKLGITDVPSTSSHLHNERSGSMRRRGSSCAVLLFGRRKWVWCCHPSEAGRSTVHLRGIRPGPRHKDTLRTEKKPDNTNTKPIGL